MMTRILSMRSLSCRTKMAAALWTGSCVFVFRLRSSRWSRCAEQHWTELCQVWPYAQSC